MEIKYLNWAKDRDQELHARTDIHTLLSSAVYEPTDMLLEDIRKFQEVAADYLHQLGVHGHVLLKKQLARQYGTNPDNIVITNGASNGIYLINRLLLQKGDHVIIEKPCYEPLRSSPEFIRADIRYIARRPPDYRIDPDELIDMLKPQTKLITLTNLHNPSGTLMDDDFLLELAAAAKAKSPHIKIMVDEIYHDFLPEIPRPAAALDDCFITLNSLTKVYGLGAIHCGWIIADRATTYQLLNLHTLVEGTGSRLVGGLATLISERFGNYHARAIELVKANRQIAHQYLQPLINKGLIEGEIPRNGCIYFPKININMPVDVLTEKLASDYSVYVVPGKFFDMPENIRIGFGGPEDMLKPALAKFCEAIAGLAKKAQ